MNALTFNPALASEDRARNAAPGCAPGEIEAPEPKTLNRTAVWAELMFCIRQNVSFLGQAPEFWKELVCDKAQKIADEADMYEHAEWNIGALEEGRQS